jgi:hypothetical protein
MFHYAFPGNMHIVEFSTQSLEKRWGGTPDAAARSPFGLVAESSKWLGLHMETDKGHVLNANTTFGSKRRVCELLKF